GTSPGWTNPFIPADDGGLGSLPFSGGPSPTGEPIRKHAAAIVHLDVDETGHVTSADERGEAVTWNVSTGEETGRFATGGLVLGHVPSVGGAVILSADPEGTVRVWDSQTESVTHELVGHEGPVAAL